MLSVNLQPCRPALAKLVLLFVAMACQSREKSSVSAPPASASASRHTQEIAPPSGSAGSAATETRPPAACAAGMAAIPGGKFWVDSDPKEHFAEDESPRFLSQLAPYCLDLTEVRVSAYRACVERGACSAPVDKQFHCNFKRAERSNHPINCVTWTQAERYCAAAGLRLPSEAEWEFAARGGEEYRDYPWGNAAPDGRTCWKSPHSCAVQSFAPGAFGVYDLTGNVWEWVDDYYGPYPWPPPSGFSRVYRGGSWSRRFEKWLHTRLRNREAPGFSGSHLGFRCAASLPTALCPFGRDESSGRCRAGVLERACEAPRLWNGVRCALPGEPRCRQGRVELPGHGCVLAEEAPTPDVDMAAEVAGVERAASPEFEPDCQRNFRDRPHAFRYSGGTHRGRNLVSRNAGCKNRDVGVGFNSTCCP